MEEDTTGESGGEYQSPLITPLNRDLTAEDDEGGGIEDENARNGGERWRARECDGRSGENCVGNGGEGQGEDNRLKRLELLASVYLRL